MGKLTAESLKTHLEQVVDLKILGQISPEALQAGYEGMTNALNQPQRSNTREAGHSR